MLNSLLRRLLCLLNAKNISQDIITGYKDLTLYKHCQKHNPVINNLLYIILHTLPGIVISGAYVGSRHLSPQ